MYGFGLLKGLKITMKRFFKKKVTQQYPEVQPNLPPRSHGSFKFDFDKCIACNMCADACPNSVIRVDFTKDEKGKRVLQKYNMSLGYCLFCGLCVKACPKDAINFSTEFHMSCYDIGDSSYYWNKPVVQATDAETAVEVSAESENVEKGLEV
jgi:NADH-quinone oxidoreductase subunit I